MSLYALRWHMIVIAMTAIIASIFLKIFHPLSANFPLLFIIIIFGIPLIFNIILKLIKGDFGADLLAAIAIITAVILGEYLAASLIIFMLVSGQVLESYATKKASSALRALIDRMPLVAHRKTPTGIEDVALREICIGDAIVIYPHEICPVDGTVVEGRSSMDESYLTGEPYLISKAPGTSVLSGAINKATALTITATKLPADSRYASIVQVLQEAELKRPTLRRLTDQIAAVFAPLTLIFASATWYITGDEMRFLSVLVMATPCPLLIAIPIAMISAISLAARKGIIIKDPAVLESLPTCRTAIFDKTGTLTYGKPSLTHVVTVAPLKENFILQLAASLERYSKHPLASAIISAAQVRGLPLLEASYVSENPGQGLVGVINNHKIQITSREKLTDAQRAHPNLPHTLGGLECVILFDEEYAATFRFRDVPRSDSENFVRHLGPVHRFNKVMLVSGDRESEVTYLGNLLGLSEVYASKTPAEKLEIVRFERSLAPTLFMGDGINDAPALTAATVGIAFGQHSNVTSQAARVTIMDSSLHKVDVLMHLSLDTRKMALQSAVGGMALSIVGMGFAAAGFITPVAGALLQEAIDVLAIFNSLRLAFKSAIDTDF